MIRYRDKYKVKSLPLFIKEVKIFIKNIYPEKGVLKICLQTFFKNVIKQIDSKELFIAYIV